MKTRIIIAGAAVSLVLAAVFGWNEAAWSATSTGRTSHTHSSSSRTHAKDTGGMDMANCPMSGDHGSCCGRGGSRDKCGMMSMMPKSAIAVIRPASGSNVSGWVKFTQTDKGVEIEADVSGLTPGKHGFHIHQYGDESAADAMSAGGHFNPDSVAHGAPTAMVHHAGDLGNLEADASGHAMLKWTDAKMCLVGPCGIVGRAVIIHAKEDDLISQPVGNAGPRIGIGVIGIAKSPQ